MPVGARFMVVVAEAADPPPPAPRPAPTTAPLTCTSASRSASAGACPAGWTPPPPSQTRRLRADMGERQAGKYVQCGAASVLLVSRRETGTEHKQVAVPLLNAPGSAVQQRSTTQCRPNKRKPAPDGPSSSGVGCGSSCSQKRSARPLIAVAATPGSAEEGSPSPPSSSDWERSICGSGSACGGDTGDKRRSRGQAGGPQQQRASAGVAGGKRTKRGKQSRAGRVQARRNNCCCPLEAAGPSRLLEAVPLPSLRDHPRPRRRPARPPRLLLLRAAGRRRAAGRSGSSSLPLAVALPQQVSRRHRHVRAEERRATRCRATTRGGCTHATAAAAAGGACARRVAGVGAARVRLRL